MGDFNRQIGDMLYNEEVIRGKFSTGKKNNNGERIISFKKRNWTWQSLDRKTQNKIDFILTKNQKHFMTLM